MPGAQYYRVYEYNPSSKKYIHLGKTANLSLVHKKMSAGSMHRYLVKACFVNKAGKELCSPFTANDIVQATLLCRAPSVKAAVSGKTVTLRWDKCAGTKFYRVYEYNTKTKKYTTLVKSTEKINITLAKRTSGIHYYLVRAFNGNGAGSGYAAKNLVKVRVK